MARSYILVAAILLSSSCLPLYAQQPTSILSQIQEFERTDLDAAKQWARENQFPEIYFLDDESILGIVGFRNEHPVFFSTHNQKASTITRTASLHEGSGLGLNLDGSNLSIGIWDASLVYANHQEHSIRVLGKESGGASNHATHVAGTLIASGITPEARGMAPKARLHSYNWNFHLSEMFIEAEKNLLVSNHSYGRIAGWHKFNLSADSSRWQWFGDPVVSPEEDYTFGYYDQEAANFDQITYSNPYYLPVVSAGNERDDSGPTTGLYLALDLDKRWREYDISTHPIQPDGDANGYDTITSMALAKNVLTVGSVYSDTTENTLNLSTFSSAGPTDDGRIKPDLVGVGERLFSTVATGNADYAVFSGTSMATPNISGSILLLQQLSNQLFGRFMKAATLKGLVLHTASDLGTEGPDYKYGWGLLNAEHAALKIQAAFKVPSLMQEHVLEQDSIFQQNLINPETGDIKVTLSWTDPGSKPLIPSDATVLDNATPSLTHNLDLKLVHQSTSQAFFPFKLDPQTPEKPATTGPNKVDPIEQVFIQDAPAGAYTLAVEAPEGLSYTNEQPFSLIITGLEDAVIPVALESATIHQSPGNVHIEWAIQNQNIPGVFAIERAQVITTQSNTPETSFYQEIAIIASNGISQKIERYTHSDPLYISGLYKYRLLFQPENSTTKVLLQEFDIDLPVPQSLTIESIYPNPAAAYTTLVLDLPGHSPIDVQIFNALGQLVMESKEPNAKPGRHFLLVDLTATSQGLYFAKIKADGRVISTSFVVVK